MRTTNSSISDEMADAPPIQFFVHFGIEELSRGGCRSQDDSCTNTVLAC